jgi:hypothetical protein
MFRQVLIPTCCTGIYEYRVSENTKYYTPQQSILQESGLSMWADGRTVVPFTNGLTNVL